MNLADLSPTKKEYIQLLGKYFIHQADTFARQGKDGDDWRFFRAYDEAGNSIPLKPVHVLRHLEGKQTLGVYQLRDDTVKWLCFDIDIPKHVKVNGESWHDTRAQTKRLAQFLGKMKIPFAVEHSGSRGIHVWVFFDTPIAANKVQRFGKGIIQNIELMDGVTIELFPKQTRAVVGNLLKLPLGVHNKTGKRTLFVNSKFEPYEDQLTALKSLRTVTEADVDECIGVLLPKAAEEVNDTPDTFRGGLPCFGNVLHKGIEPGNRDNVMFRTAVYLKNMQLTEDQVQATLYEWNTRNNPPIDESRIDRKIDSAFKGDYGHFPCQEIAFDVHCVQSCRWYEKKMRDRVGG